jgi:hypothetical protein
MSDEHTIVAVFETHSQAEDAVKQVASSGFPMAQLSIVGKGYHTDEKVIGFYNAGDRIKLWGKYGAFWGGLWGLFVGGLFMTIPFVGPVVVLGHLAAMLVGFAEGAILVGGVSALAGALASIGIPKDAVVRYEEAVKADNFVVVAHGTPDVVARAKAVLQGSDPKTLDLHHATTAEHAHRPAA